MPTPNSRAHKQEMRKGKAEKMKPSYKPAAKKSAAKKPIKKKK